MHLPHSPDLTVRPSAPIRVGRLVPLDGIPPRPHPDRAQLRQFLREVRLPLAAIQTMLEIADDPAVPVGSQMALRAAANHTDYLLDLVADYVEWERLEADIVTPAPLRTELVRWVEACLGAQQPKAADAGNALRLQHRSFLPSHVEFDSGLAARALDGVLRVALQRALPGTIEVRVAYLHDKTRPGAAHLTIEVVTRGGGFADVEQGYVFTPFAVRDAAARPLLGLGIAQRLCHLLGGHLRVTSPGRSVCTYTLSLVAPPCADARWLDLLAADHRHHGPVCPGRVLFVGRNSEARRIGGALLQRAGYSTENVESEEILLQRLGNQCTDCSAVVLDATCSGVTLGGFVDALRAQGFGGKIVRCLPAGAEATTSSFVDAVLPAQFTGELLLAAIAREVTPPPAG